VRSKYQRVGAVCRAVWLVSFSPLFAASARATPRLPETATDSLRFAAGDAGGLRQLQLSLHLAF
jgi:hypothetical protein